MYYYDDDKISTLHINRIIPENPLLSGECGTNLTYLFNFNSSVLTISGSGDMNDYNETSSPFGLLKYYVNYINIGKGATSIGEYAFYKLKYVIIVNLSDSITSIKRDAFAYCENISSIKIPESVNTLGDYAFYNCISLESINISLIEYMGHYVFGYCNFTSFDIQYGYKIVSEGLLHGCTMISSIIIPDSVEIIDNYAFYQCTSLSSILIPKSVVRIDRYAFGFCTSLISINVSHVKKFGSNVFSDCHSLASFDIPSEITYIPDYFFSNCYNISSIYIPNTITSIGHDAFYGCTSLLSVIIPENVTILNSSLFSGCKSLKSVEINGNCTEIKYDAFKDCSSLSYLLYKGSKVPKITSSSFTRCNNLTIIDVMYYYEGDKFGDFEIRRNNFEMTSSDVDEIIDSSLDDIDSSSDVIDSSSIFVDEITTEDSSIIIESSSDVEESETNEISSSNIDDQITDDSSTPYLSFDISEANGSSSIIDDQVSTEDSSIPNSFSETIEAIESSINNVETTELITEEPSTNEIIPIKCETNVHVGCLLCNKNYPYQCLSCDKNQFFNEEVDINGECQCVSQYELNDAMQCVPEIARCEPSAIENGCSLCYLYNKSICATCDINRGFKSELIKGNICECMNQDFDNSQGKCVELSVPCKWGDDQQPVSGCTLCHSHRPNQCVACDESKGLIINNITRTCECQHDGYEINSQGQCVPPSNSHCNEEEMIGCIMCNDKNDHQCITCDSSKGFILSSNMCKCEIEGYEISEEGFCVPPKDTLCMSNVSIAGCLKCSESNNQRCANCDTTFNFNEIPDSNGLLTCANDYILGVNSYCIKYVKEEPILSVTDYVGTKEIPSDYLSTTVSFIKLDTSKMKDKNDYNEDKLYNKEVPSTVTEVLVEKNSLENIQLRINNRENAELKVQIEPKQQIQIDISRSKFPINLQANSQNLSLKVESSDSQLEVKADNNNNDVIIGNVSVSQNSFVFIPRTNVIVEYVNLLGDAEISRTKSESDDENKVKLTAKKVNLQRGSESKISNILISEQLNLAPDSAIEIKEGVDFSTAEFSIYKSIAQPMSYTQFPPK